MTCYKLAFENRVMAFNFALDKDGKIAGLSITAYVPPNIPEPDRNITQLSLPFNGEWTVFWGGDTKELNQHVSVRAQKNAFDIVKTDATGKSYRTDGSTNEDYYAFGEPLLAPCDAEVVMAVDGVKDNMPGDQNPIYVPGNAVMLRTAANEYILMAHFKNHSLRVHEGDKVARGQVLGLCGNSGNSSEPHLHLHMENVEDMNIATGIKCYFSKILVNGTAASDYSPVKGDKVANVR
jgi:murein DD-endopeptidase MepM/ murein hydrolase activator NlpD